jgi:hypothetical protein
MRCLAVVLAVLVMAAFAADSSAAPKPKAKAPAVAKKAPDASAVDRLTLRQRRSMGLTLGDMLAAARDLRAAGAPVTAEAIRDHLASQRPQAFAPQAPNWDNILAFIERLLPLILKLMDLFAVVDQPQAPYMLAWLPGQRIIQSRPARRLLDRRPLRTWLDERRPARRVVGAVVEILA